MALVRDYLPGGMRVEWSVGDVIRKLRLTAQWRLEDAAAAAGVSFQAISEIELGKTKDPRGKTLASIAAAFGLTERQLRNAVPEPIELPIRLAGEGKPRRALTADGQR